MAMDISGGVQSCPLFRLARCYFVVDVDLTEFIIGGAQINAEIDKGRGSGSKDKTHVEYTQRVRKVAHDAVQKRNENLEVAHSTRTKSTQQPDRRLPRRDCVKASKD